ncbi:MAG: hypothetical protein IJX09_03850, partial [Clostridia bacterium]|nr:hypothetical protein [Clostridia bacterium]
MKKKAFKQSMALLMTAFLGISIGACGGNSGNSSNTPDKPKDLLSAHGNPLFDGVSSAPYTTEDYTFTTIFIDKTEKRLPRYDAENPKSNPFVEYDVYSNIKDKNYLKLNVETDVDVVGYIHYEKNGDPSVTNTEKFFIAAGSTEFCTFLDAFRVGAQGAYAKTILTISFQSVDSTKEGTFRFISAGISDRTMNTVEEWYVSDGSSVLGTSPYYGGCITYFEKLEEDVYEYMDADGNICIDKDVDPDFVQQVSSANVNLVNIYDLGREIQPSYYLNVSDKNGYEPDYDPEDKDSYYPGLTETGKPIYNPIQCGDFGGHTPQIIDYEYASDKLYVKMKAQEWFFYTNIQANGYIEVTYYFDESGALMVDNVYTDFSQFYGIEEVSISVQETPATYFAYPLNYFYCETKQGVIFDKEVGEQNGRTEIKSSKTQAVGEDYYYVLNGKMVNGGWCAFVNENKWGVGICLPNADKYVASRGRKSNSYFQEEGNREYHEDYFTFAEEQLVPS